MEIKMTGPFLRGVVVAVGLSGLIVTGLSGFAHAIRSSRARSIVS
jgi:hypothetical protein